MLPLLIQPADLKPLVINAKSGQLIIVDLGKEERFLEEHIPGAKLVTPAETQKGAPVPGLLPSDAALTELAQRIGLTPDSHVVVYDDEGGGWAGRFIWLLDEIGHTSYSYLDGGLVAWKAAAYPMEAGKAELEKSSLTVRANHDHTVTMAELTDLLNDEALLVWDARSPQEYSGEKANSKRGGHIPGAVHYEWTQAMDQSRNLRLKPLDELRRELKAKGIVADKKIVTHCQSHHRSGLSYLIGKILGFKDMKAYAGSWSEWGNSDTTKIETGGL